MRKFISFEDAVTEYSKIIGVTPNFDKMCELYHLYRNTFESYKWESFEEFVQWNK